MLSLLALQIVWLANVQDFCHADFEIGGCYYIETKTVYVGNVPGIPREYFLYHEIGHHLLWGKTNYHEERIATEFSFWVLANKGTLDKNIKRDKSMDKIFKQYCDKECLGYLLSLHEPKVYKKGDLYNGYILLYNPDTGEKL